MHLNLIDKEGRITTHTFPNKSFKCYPFDLSDPQMKSFLISGESKYFVSN